MCSTERHDVDYRAMEKVPSHNGQSHDVDFAAGFREQLAQNSLNALEMQHLRLLFPHVGATQRDSETSGPEFLDFCNGILHRRPKRAQHLLIWLLSLVLQHIKHQLDTSSLRVGLNTVLAIVPKQSH